MRSRGGASAPPIEVEPHIGLIVPDRFYPRMYFAIPPHFHALYGDDEALVRTAG